MHSLSFSRRRAAGHPHTSVRTPMPAAARTTIPASSSAAASRAGRGGGLSSARPHPLFNSRPLLNGHARQARGGRPAVVGPPRRVGTNPSQHARGGITTAASWRDYLPRIVDSFSRRVPPPPAVGGAPSPSASLPFTLPSATDTADAARRLFFPESLADPATLTVPVLIFGALAVGVGVEVASLALRALPGGGGGHEEGGGGGGAGPAALTADEEEDEEQAPPPPALFDPLAPAGPANPDRVMGERYRGLAWLAGAAGLALYSAGLLTGSEKPLQP